MRLESGTWRPGASRGAHKLPTDHPVDVGAAKMRFAPFPFPRYRFDGGIAQATRGVEIFVERDVPQAKEALAGLVDLLSEVPQSILDHVAQVRLLGRQDRWYDRVFRTLYGIKGFEAVAAGGDGTISFFGGRVYGVGSLFHELGHNLPVDGGAWDNATRADNATITAAARDGKLVADEFEPVPDPVRRARWTPRLAPGAITPYGASSGAEDIAEALRMLMAERHFGHSFAHVEVTGGGTRDLAFSAAYPARTAILERVAKADLDGDGDIGA